VPQNVFADPKRIKQILMNMMSNALKFTNSGWISVTFELEDLPAKVSLTP
jgi:signal transduction histidine kinase